MALGGGNFLVQNKILPGAYINFVSVARATATLSDRGVATMPLILNWGPLDTIMEVTTGDLQKNSVRLFGYDYTAPELAGLRDLFKNIRKAYLYRLGTGGEKASNTYANAKYEGQRGNDIQVVIAENVDNNTLFDVSVYFDGVLVDKQIGAGTNTDHLTDNDFVTWKDGIPFTATAGMPLSGGLEPTISNGDYQTYLDRIEPYAFNAIGCPSDNVAIKGLFTAFTKRMRDEQGVKFQCVTYNNPADHEGVVNVINSATGNNAPPWAAVYWTTGVIAGTPVNRSALNKVYDGEYELESNFTQSQLENAIRNGRFAFHRVGSDVRVLSDINSLVNITLEKGDVFKENQTIRVIDQIANDIAVLFNTKYLGIVPNDKDGQVSLWSDIVKHHELLLTIRAIEDFSGDDVKVSRGDTKRAVVVEDYVTPVNAMAQLYMVVMVN